MGTVNLQIATWGNLSSNGHTIPSGKDSKKCVTYNDLKSVSTAKSFAHSYYRTPGSAYNSALTINMPITKVTSGISEAGKFTAVVGKVIYSFKPPTSAKSMVKLPLNNMTIEHWENTSSLCREQLKLKIYLVNSDSPAVILKESSTTILCYHNANTSGTQSKKFTINWADFEIDFSKYDADSQFEVRIDYSRDPSYTSSSGTSHMQYHFIFNYNSNYVNYYTSCKCVAYNLIQKK